MIRFFLWFTAAVISLVSCNTKKNHELLSGPWRATLNIQNQSLPFNLYVEKDSADYRIYILNAKDSLLLHEITFKEDSVIIPMHIFDASIHAKVEDHKLTGVFIKHYEKDYRIPFQADHGATHRFAKSTEVTGKNYTGKFSVRIFEETDTTDAVGVFTQDNNKVTGTFLTPTGDYRFLEGNVVNDSLYLSLFDGNYAYLFKAGFETPVKISGRFYSGKSKKVRWEGIRNDTATLVDSESLTQLKKGYDKIDFSFPDVNKNYLSLKDPRFQNKVVILQLLGSWCPNCMDETKFLAPWYDKNKGRGVEIVGLAYERKADFNYASDRVKKMVSRMNMHYPVLIAGTNDKEEASKTLPMLEKVVAFPTTIFIGRDGKVKKIHTGFSGQGTGQYFEEFVQYFNQTVNDLLNEEPAKTKQSF
jgi:thiol-disulfide isomerase/thioredoxin